MDHTGSACQASVARYDDDYPLLYGEPAPQPQWRPVATGRCVRLPQDGTPEETAANRPATCKTCGRCGR
jgi:hypothetical protein